MASPDGSAARSAGRGQRASHASYTGRTRATGVCWRMNSETSKPHGVAVVRRHGRSRACASYHRRSGAWRSDTRVMIGLGSRLASALAAVVPWIGAGAREQARSGARCGRSVDRWWGSRAGSLFRSLRSYGGSVVGLASKLASPLAPVVRRIRGGAREQARFAARSGRSADPWWAREQARFAARSGRSADPWWAREQARFAARSGRSADPWWARE